MRALLVAALLALTPLAGCLGLGDAPGTEAPDPEAVAAADAEAARAEEASRTATSPDDMTGGHAPHIHNYWGESDRVTLFDGEVEIPQDELFPTMVNVILLRQAAVGGAFWELPDGATVYEGTGLMEVTTTWTDATITGLQLYYKSADKQFERDGFAGPVPLQKDVPTTIEVTPAMTDMPHDAISRWAFYFAPAGTPAVAEGRFHLKIDIVRMRDVMEFPGHPDTYEDTSHYVLSDEDFTYRSPAFYTATANLLLGGQTREAIVPAKPVPMETRALLFEIQLAQSSTTAPLAKTQGVFMLYTTAVGRQVWEGQVVNQTEDGRIVFGIPLEDNEVDSPYTDASAWRFYLWLRTGSDAPVPLLGQCGGCFDSEFSGHLKITAFAEDPLGGKIPPPKEYRGN